MQPARGLPRAPSRYSPYHNLKAAKDRQQYVLGRMVEEKYISQAEADAAAKAPLSIRSRRSQHMDAAAFFTEQVRRDLEATYGRDLLYRGGLGDEWREAGVYARWLVPWLAAGVVNVPSMSILLVLKMQKYLLVYETALLAARVLAILVPGLMNNVMGAIVSYSVVGVLANTTLILATSWFVRSKSRATLSPG